MAGYIGLDSDDPGYGDFVASDFPPDPPDDSQKMRADAKQFSKSMVFSSWAARARQIRQSGSDEWCNGNLSIALDVGAIYSAGMAAANTILSLIPTAGVLVGSSVQELWILYKLCPLAGMLSIMLSLGGNITPGPSSNFDNVGSYRNTVLDVDAPALDDDGHEPNKSEAELFAVQVAMRARNTTGSNPVIKVGIGILIQVCLIGVVLTACWFLESGAVVIWWCELSSWTFLWYSAIAFASILENFAGVPFTNSYKIRVWRIPPVVLDEGSPWLAPQQVAPSVSTRINMDSNQDEAERQSQGRDNDAHRLPADNETNQDVANRRSQVGESHSHGLNLQVPSNALAPEETISPQGPDNNGEQPRQEQESQDDRSKSPSVPPKSIRRKVTTAELLGTDFWTPADTFGNLERGYTTKAAIHLDQSMPWSLSSESFYVVLSATGVSGTHAALRVISKGLSLAVFGFGTGLFAAVALVDIQQAFITSAMIVGSGMFGRLTSMWMTATMMQNRPVLHRIVRNRFEAAKYLSAIINQTDLACEVTGHIIIHGRVVKRHAKRLRWVNVFGVLTRPYDVTNLAKPPGRGPEL